MEPDDERFDLEWLMKAVRWLVPHRCISCRRRLFFVAYLDCVECDVKRSGHTTSPEVEPTESDVTDL